MTSQERSAAKASSLNSLKESSTEAVASLKSYLHALREEKKEDLVTAQGDDIQRLQGACVVLDEILTDLSRTSRKPQRSGSYAKTS
jgi:hypothetical protein